MGRGVPVSAGETGAAHGPGAGTPSRPPARLRARAADPAERTPPPGRPAARRAEEAGDPAVTAVRPASAAPPLPLLRGPEAGSPGRRLPVL